MAGIVQTNLFDIPFDALTQKEVLEHIRTRIKRSQQTRIVTINPEFIVESFKNPEFKDILKTANLHLADGIGIIWATNFLQRITNKAFLLIKLCISLVKLFFVPKSFYNPLPAKVTGSELFLPLIELLAEEKQKVFLLGAAPGVADTVAKKLRTTNSALQIVGTCAGSPKAGYSQEIVQMINDSQANALFVAFQFPQQDIWIAKYLEQMPQVKVAIGIGGTFDSIAQTSHINYRLKAKKTPWFMKLHLEWLWRLITQPYRWRRIFNATFKFIWLVYKEARVKSKKHRAKS